MAIPTPFVNGMEVLPINTLSGPEIGPMGGGMYAFSAASIGASPIKLHVKGIQLSDPFIEAGELFTSAGGWTPARIPAGCTIKLTQTASNAINVLGYVAESLHRR